MTIDILSFKKLNVYSAIFGAGLGIPALVPNIMPVISLFILPFLSGIIILTLMKIREEIDKNQELTIKDYALFGAVVGITSGFSFLIIFTPAVVLLHLLMKNYYTYGLDYLNFFLACVLIISVTLIFGTTNSVGGLLVGFLLKQFSKN